MRKAIKRKEEYRIKKTGEEVGVVGESEGGAAREE